MDEPFHLEGMMFLKPPCIISNEVTDGNYVHTKYGLDT